MDAKELRKKLDEGLKPDTSGKTTPIQRLAPFLVALCDYLAMTEDLATQYYKQVSSDDATQAVPAKTKHESVGASKPAA